MDAPLNLSKDQIETQYLISTSKFLLLSFSTFGLYNIWWFYKAWRLFGQLERKHLAPAIRAIFAIFFTLVLFDRILKLAKKNGYQKSYSSTLLFLGFLLAGLLSWLPDPFYLTAQIGVFFLVLPFQAFSYALKNEPNIHAVVQERFNIRQIVLLVVGLLCWIIITYGSYLMMTEEYIY